MSIFKARRSNKRKLLVKQQISSLGKARKDAKEELMVIDKEETTINDLIEYFDKLPSLVSKQAKDYVTTEVKKIIALLAELGNEPIKTALERCNYIRYSRWKFLCKEINIILRTKQVTENKAKGLEKTAERIKEKLSQLLNTIKKEKDYNYDEADDTSEAEESIATEMGVFARH